MPPTRGEEVSGGGGFTCLKARQSVGGSMPGSMAKALNPYLVTLNPRPSISLPSGDSPYDNPKP